MKKSFGIRISVRACQRLAVAVFLVASLPQFARANIITVKDSSDPNFTPGCSLRRAIENHNSKSKLHPDCEAGDGNDQIYIPNDNRVLQGNLPPIDGTLEILRVSPACGIIRDFAYLTINPGAKLILYGVGMSANGGRDVSMIDNNGGTLIIKQYRNPCEFTNRKPSTPPENGGVIFNRNNGQVSISGAHFVDSFATGAGGAIYNDSGTITIDDSAGRDKNAFLNNTAFKGGAIFNQPGGTVRINSSNFSISHNNAGDAGGAIFNASGVLEIRAAGSPIVENVIKDNHSVTGGAGIYSSGGALTIDRVTIRDNSASNGSGGGIAIFNQAATITRSYLFNNRAHFFGGAIYATQGTTLNVSASTFWRNNAEQRGGGGIDADELSNVKVVNSTFLSSPNGRDGIDIESGRAEMVSSTMEDTNLIGSVELANNLLVKVSCNGIFDDGFNLQFNSTGCPSSIRVANPMIPVNLNDHGGPTPTIPIRQGSPALNQIPIGNCIDFQKNPIATDQRGFKRPFANSCDIGAFEFGATQ